MDGRAPAPAPVLGKAADLVRSGHAPVEDLDRAFASLAEQIGTENLALVILFVSPSADLARAARLTERTFGEVPVIGCTTAGEIADQGYTADEIVAIGLPAEDFRAGTLFVERLSDLGQQDIVARAVRLRGSLAREAPEWSDEFGFLLVDGMSLREDQLAWALGPAFGLTPFFGGSAGDGLSFERAFVFHKGAFHADAAVLAVVRTRCRVEVFKFDHLRPTARKMVVTEADPEHRLVSEINAEPAAREYARLVGKDPEQLSPFIFAAHPVVVKVGGKHHVRAIQKVEPNGDLRFFSAIDEGLVLTVAEPLDMAEHLEGALNGLARGTAPDAIIACDCILRRVEAEQKQAIGKLSRLLSSHRVVGFSTYGEQINSVHVNQTMTGIAIYPPEPAETS